MQKKVLQTIEKFNMIQDNDNIIVGVSGGADSICLLHVLHSLKKYKKINIHVVHIHHGIRGKDADADAEYVQSYSKSIGLKSHVFYYDIKQEASKNKVSEEEMGRIIRYKVFNKVCCQHSNSKIAVAHHMNDQVETILMNLFRGTGAKGLGGIRPVRDNIIRPLIECTRDEIETYCAQYNLRYHNDITNEDEVYTRNRIRHSVIPFIEENFNSQFVSSVVQTADLIREEDEYLQQLAEQKAKDYVIETAHREYTIDLKTFNKEHLVIKNRIIRAIFSSVCIGLKDIEYKHIKAIIDLGYKEVSKEIHLPGDIIARKSYDSIIITPNRKEERFRFLYDIEVPGEIFIKELGKNVKFNILNYEKKTIIPKNLYTKWFDYDKIKYNLTIRSRVQGDIIKLGDQTTKKLKKYFIDNKIPREERDYIPLLADGNNIIWVIGQRISYDYKVTNKTTRILEVKY